jgi:hypothetical protein
MVEQFLVGCSWLQIKRLQKLAGHCAFVDAFVTYITDSTVPWCIAGMAIAEKPGARIRIRSRTRVVKRHPEGDW